MANSRPQTHLLPFVGRNDALRGLKSACNSDSSVVVWGAAGIGKSRLVQELTQQLSENAIVLCGRTEESADPVPFRLWCDIAADGEKHLLAADSLAQHGLALGQQQSCFTRFRDGVPSPADMSLDSLRLGWVDYFERLAQGASRRIVIVVEDVHHADADSMSLLRWLLSHPLSVTFVITSRSDPDLGLPMVELDPLTESDVQQILSTTSFSLNRARGLLSITGGLPVKLRDWFAEAKPNGTEAADRLIEEGALAALGQQTRSVLEVGALLGSTFDLVTAAALADVDLHSSGSQLDGVLHSLYLEPVPGSPSLLHFHHATHRTAILDQLSYRRRALLHRRILEWLRMTYSDDLTKLSELAYHATQASVLGDRREAIDLNLRAGQRSLQLFAPESAKRYFETALELSSALGNRQLRLTALLGIALALRVLADPAISEVLDEVLQLADDLHDSEAYAKAALAIPTNLGPVGMPFRGDEHAAWHLERAQQRLKEDDPLLVRVLCELAIHRHATATETEYFRIVERAERLAERHGDVDLVHATYVARHGLRRPAGVLESLHSESKAILRSAPSSDPASALSLFDVAITSHLRAGDLDGTVELLRQIDSTVAPVPLRSWTQLRVRAGLALASGDLKRAEQLALQAAQATVGTRHRDSVDLYFAFHVAALLRESAEFHAGGEAIKEWIDRYPHYLAFRAARAWQRADAQDPDGALDDARYVFGRDLRDHRSRVEGLITIAMALQAGCSGGDVKIARSGRDLLEPYRKEWLVVGGGTLVEGPVLRVLGLAAATLGNYEQAVGELTEARQVAKTAGASLWQWHAVRDLACVHRAFGQDKLAADCFGEAVNWYKQAGLAGMAKHVENGATPLKVGSSPERSQLSRSSDPSSGLIRRERRTWSFQLEEESVSLPHRKGFAMLAELLTSPGRGTHVTVLSRIAEGNLSSQSNGEDSDRLSSQPSLDRKAIAAYQRRLATLKMGSDRADRRGDEQQSDAIAKEMADLVSQLSEATGLGNRKRDLDPSLERARVRVTKAIRSAIAQLSEAAPALGGHLAASIRTGSFCSYEPDPRRSVSWTMTAAPDSSNRQEHR